MVENNLTHLNFNHCKFNIIICIKNIIIIIIIIIINIANVIIDKFKKNNINIQK
jgi:hypothetical protein